MIYRFTAPLLATLLAPTAPALAEQTKSQSVPALTLPHQSVMHVQTTNHKSIKQGVTYASKRNWKKLHTMALHANPNTARNRTVVGLTWLALTYDSTTKPTPYTFDEIKLFITRHPYLPQQRTMHIRAERQMTDSLPIATVENWFNLTNNTYYTYTGARQYLRLLKHRGDMDTHNATVPKIFHTHTMTTAEQSAFIKKYTLVLKNADFVKRIDTLLWRRQITLAKPLLSYVSKKQQNLFNVRIALMAGRYRGHNPVGAVAPSLQNDDGLHYATMRWHMRKSRYTDAKTAYIKRPYQTVDKPSPYQSLWDSQALLLTKKLLYRKQHTTAYGVANTHNANPNTLTGRKLNFMAGFIALRLLHNGEGAIPHFNAVATESSTPISKARKYYWLGRAYKFYNDTANATQHFKTAGQYTTTFYGQMALRELGQAIPPQSGDTPPPMTTAEQKSFNTDPMVNIITHLNHNGVSRLAHELARRYVGNAQSIAQLYQFSQLGHATNNLNWAVWANRKMRIMGTEYTNLGYPVPQKRLPHIRGSVYETLAIIRQESSFQNPVKSSAGALGYMQILPSTGRYLARKVGVPYSLNRLRQDGNYNIKLGSTYIQHLLSGVNNAYPLAYASYNAGQGNVKKWVKNHPHDMGDLYQSIDWIERIPFDETRNYVMRVLENMTIYKAKLKNSPQKLVLYKN